MESVEYLYSMNISHQDIKLENFLIQNDKIKISDFGFASITKPHKDPVPKGTIGYLAVERILYPEK